MARSEEGFERLGCTGVSACPFMMLLMAAALLPSADLHEPVLFGHLNLAYTLLTSGGLWASHAAAIAQDPALQQAIVRVLFDCCLPATAAALQRDALTGVHQAGIQLLLRLPDVLHDISLRSTVEQHSRGPAAAQAPEHAATILSLLLASHSGSLPGQIFSLLLVKATGLLAACLYGMAKQQMAAIRRDTVAAPLARQADMIAAGWHAVQLLPRLAASFTAEMEDPMAHTSFPGGLSGWLGSMSATCGNLCQPLLLVYSLPLVGCSPAQLATWLEAVAASLRLLPRMVALDARLKQHSSRFDGAEVGCGQLLRLPVVLLPLRLEQSQQQLEQLHSSTGELHPDDTAAWQSLQSQLWALHTSLCRLIAALTAPAAPLSVPDVQLTSLHWDSLLLSLHSSLHCILLAHAHEHPLHEARQARWSLAVIVSAPRYAAQASRLAQLQLASWLPDEAYSNAPVCCSWSCGSTPHCHNRCSLHLFLQGGVDTAAGHLRWPCAHSACCCSRSCSAERRLSAKRALGPSPGGSSAGSADRGVCTARGY